MNDKTNLPIETSFSSEWHLPASIALVALVGLVVLIVALYRSERGKSRTTVRGLLIAVRLLLIGMTFLMIFGWQRNSKTMDKSDLVILVDASASMNVADHYGTPEFTAAIMDFFAETPDGDPTRIEIARAILTGKESGLEKLKQKYHVKLFRLDASLQRLDDFKSDTKPSNGNPSSLLTDPQTNETVANLKADGKESRIGDGLISVIKTQRGRPTSAIILLTDGVNTAGKLLTEASRYANQKSIPFYIIGIGSPVPPKDVRLSELQVASNVFVEDTVHVAFNLHSTSCNSESVRLELRVAGSPTPLAKKEVELGKLNQTQPIRMTFRPDKIGSLDLTIRAVPIDGERNHSNNYLSSQIQVCSETMKILLVADYPNREFHFLKQLLTRSTKRKRESETDQRSIELKTLLQSGDLKYASTDKTALRVFPVREDDLFEYDVVILSDVRIGESAGGLADRDLKNLYEYIATRGKGLVVIAGPENQFVNWRETAAETLLPFDPATIVYPDRQLDLTDPFSYQKTNLGENWGPLSLEPNGTSPNGTSSDIWNSLAGFFWMCETPVLRSGTRVLLAHTSKRDVKGNRLPLISMQYVGAGKVVFHASPETYRWRFRARDQFFGRYWLQLMRYLSRTKLNRDNMGITISTDRDQYHSDDTVAIRIEFLDERKAPANDLGLELTLQQRSGVQKTLVASRLGQSQGIFGCQVSDLAEGEYEVWLNELKFSENQAKIKFRVAAPNAEATTLRMNESELRFIAEQTNGKMYRLTEANSLIKDLPRGKRVETSALPPDPIWKHWYFVLPFAILFLAFITTEWLVRKWNGML